MLFKIAIALVSIVAIVTLIGAMIANISYTLMKMDEERDRI